MPRMTHYFGMDAIKLAYAMIFTMPGVPFLYYGDDIVTLDSNQVLPDIVCTHYQTQTMYNSYRCATGVSMDTTSSNGMAVYDANYDTNSLAAWKSWLAAQKAAGTPVTVVYQLAEPVVTKHPGPHLRVMDEGVMFDVGIAEEHGPINRLVLSRDPQGDIVYREDADSVASHGPSELVISNNGILDYGAEDKRLAVIEDLWNAIKGCCLRSHRIKWRGDPAADTGDILCIKTAGKVYRSAVAGESLIYNGGISSTITLDLPGQTEATNTKGGLTIGEAVKRAEINVNKVSGEITSLAQRVDTVQVSASAAQAKADEAAAAAAAAQSAAEDADAKAAAAAADLTTAKQNLAAVTGRVDATEEEVAAAQAAVAEAQAAADKANADAASAQAAADAAKQAADAAQADVNALAVRVTTAETSITQNSEQILLRATKTEVTTAINDIEIGGRNLIPKSAIQSHSYYKEYENTLSGFGVELPASSSTVAFASSDIFSNFTLNETYTVSFKAIAEGDTILHFDFYPDTFYGTFGAPNVSVSTEEKTYSLTGELLNSGSPTLMNLRFFRVTSSPNYKIDVYDIKVEKGNKPTDWTPAPEDTENEIAEAIDKQTRNISSQIQQTADQITQTVSETYATKDSVQETVSASTELLSDSFTVRLEKLQEKTDANTASAEETREQFETLSQYMRYGGGVLELGDSSSPILLQHKNDRIQFVLSDGTVQSLWTPTTWELTNLLRFRLGPGVLVVQPNGSISGIKAVD